MRRQMLTGSLPLLVLFAMILAIPPASAEAGLPRTDPGAWWADYFASRDLSGSPVTSRFDDAINFTWSKGSPAKGVPADNFSVRWQREAWFSGGTYRFSILSDDGVRIWIGDQLVVDLWHDRWALPYYTDSYIAPGTHKVRVEYYDHEGDATISVGWNRLVGGAAWRGEYFDNEDLDGWPVLTRDDRAIDFDWGYGSPNGDVPTDYFSVRWTRTLGLDAGSYRFYASTDDGVRVWVDDTLLIDAWEKRRLPNTTTGDTDLGAGEHTIKVEYYDHGGEASAHVWWKALDSFAAWHGEYFDNADLLGGPTLVRGDAEIDFDWGTGAPAEWMPDDAFSVRWTRSVNLAPGYYRFVTLADDGVRFWLDGYPIIDKWEDMDYELHYVDGTYLSGVHTLRVEFYEHTGQARVRAWWEPGTSDNVPPDLTRSVGIQAATTLLPPAPAGTAQAITTGPWQANYYANASLAGDPVLTRSEPKLDHNWGWNSPGDSIPSTDFSARWTQRLDLTAGTYKFTTYTDDGVRLWVDGTLVINSWRPMRGYKYATRRFTEAGAHDLKMEYYERAGIALARLTIQRTSD
jgi:hypothetical protein